MRLPHFDTIYTDFVVLSPHFCPKFAYNSPPKADFDQKTHIGTPPERVCLGATNIRSMQKKNVCSYTLKSFLSRFYFRVCIIPMYDKNPLQTIIRRFKGYIKTAVI